MPGLVPGIRDFPLREHESWMPAASLGMTAFGARNSWIAASLHSSPWWLEHFASGRRTGAAFSL
jgi:hypothetical protein